MADSSLTDVTVKTLDSQSRSYQVGGELTVRQFKEHIASSVEIPVDKQRLIYQGRVLQDDKTLTTYNVHGKVIHLVERAPPQSTGTGSGGAEVSNEGTAEDSSGHIAASPPQDRNGYVMLGTFNLPVNFLEPQAVQQMMPGLGESGRNARVSTSTGSNGSLNVQINLDQSVQSEARMRVQLAENLLRSAHALIQRLEGVSGSQAESELPHTSSSSTASSTSGRIAEESLPMETNAPPAAAAAASTSTQTEGAPNTPPNHLRPAEFVAILSEVRRVEERLRPFIERTHSILGAATSADYNNNERDEDQRVLNMAGDALRLLGNALIVLGDLRCNLASPPPRHLYVLRPVTQHSHPVLVRSGLPHVPIPVNVGTANGGPAGENLGRPSRSDHLPSAQAPPPPPRANETTEGARVIRITHQTMEPVVMMHMNIDGDTSSGPPNATGSVQPGECVFGVTLILAMLKLNFPSIHPSMNLPGLPPEFMQAIVQQISHQAATVAAAAASANQATHTTGSAVGHEGMASSAPPAQARVIFTRPPFSPHISHPTGTRGTSINLRAAMPVAGQQAGQGTPVVGSSLAQMISNLVGQLLVQGDTTSYSSSASSQSSESSASPIGPSVNTTGQAPPPPSAPAPPPSGVSVDQPLGGSAGANLAQLLGSMLPGSGSSASGSGSGVAPSITVTLPGLFQNMSDFVPPAAGDTTEESASQTGGSLSPELFTGIVQGGLSTMTGSLGAAQHGNGESIAQFIQSLSQSSNLFTPGSGGAVGFFGDLLSLVCQSSSMMDVVLLLHGNAQPLSRIRPQLTEFFSHHYLRGGQEPTDANVARAADDLINGLEEYIAESFSNVAVRDGVDIVQSNLAFLRQQLTGIASHVLRCNDATFGPSLLLLCTQGLFECLALNLYCLGGEQRALTAVINRRIRRMFSEGNPSLLNCLTSMMSMRLTPILEHNPVTRDHIRRYVILVSEDQRAAAAAESAAAAAAAKADTGQQPAESQNVEMEETFSPATTAEEAKAWSGDGRENPPPGSAVTPPGRPELTREVEPWAASLPPEWVPIIRHDLHSQRKLRAQPPLSDAYLHGMPAKRRKMTQGQGPRLSLSDAVSRAARSAGALPVTAANSLQGELERPDLQDAYATQVKKDIKARVLGDPDYNAQKFPNTHRAFSSDDS
ncbi:large proline-rich protein BAG6 isoform X3 [Syngnathus acus]|uniref:large proline-rich protein BAG6 isoform X3 n=1 Tax=Syngnathus acus TaxID=161584 RepID=UPI001885C2C9|nr:large proline-rich protein BAG6 isoform X3 [Syngnathus acus]